MHNTEIEQDVVQHKQLRTELSLFVQQEESQSQVEIVLTTVNQTLSFDIGPTVRLDSDQDCACE